MKALLLLLSIITLGASTPNWLNDFEQAKRKAKENHQLILLNFSGSDWCGPCIKMHKKYFNSDEFAGVAEKLVLVNADFPRMKKNQLDKKTKAGNEKLAEQFNNEGKFPYTILMDEDQKVIKTWDGCPDETPAEFTQQLQALIAANK